MICAALLLSLVTRVRSGAIEFLGISALDLVLRQAFKGHFEMQCFTTCIFFCEMLTRTLKVQSFFWGGLIFFLFISRAQYHKL